MPFKGAKQFPYESETGRLHTYEVNERLLEGKHFEAFAIEGESAFSERYNKLRYIVANFNALVAKVSADMLFGEDVAFYADKNQDFVDGLVYNNKLSTQLLESAISNSALGDALFKIRVENNEIIIEDTDPAIYFPEVNGRNPRKTPDVQELAWIDLYQTEQGEEARFLVREIHTAGKVETKIYVVKGDNNIIDQEVDVKEYNAQYGTNYEPLVETNIDKPLLVFVPNMRYRGSKDFWGVSDFIDFESLQFELNNRLTKTANILDKHSDPILAVPDGVLDEEGRVKKEALQMIELGDDGEVPQYIVWNASLDNAFKEIEKMMEFLFMSSEVSPDVLGMGKDGAIQSGRALKMRLIRTIAKAERKKRYYEQALKEVFEIAQKLSVNNKGVGVTYMGKKITCKEIEPVNIVFGDGIVNDVVEETETIIKRVDAGILSKKSAIMLLDGYDDAEAEREVEEIEKSRANFTSIIDKLQPNDDEE